jgi:tripartite-type tricarboxylate transporter receptor subunit TctC
MLKRWFALAAAVLFLPVSALAAPAPNEMFRGKTITYIVSTTAGGGYDTYGRMIARYMPKYLPGARIIVRNVPGAGNIIGANAIYTARPDGTTVGMFNTGLIYNQLIGAAGMNFDIGKFSFLGKAATEARAVVLGTNSGFKSFDDMLKSRDVKFATSGIGTASWFDTRILADALKLNIQLVNNFSGNTAELSMRRGEVAGQIGTVESLEQFVKNGGGFYALEISGSEAKLPGVAHVSRYITDERARKLVALLQAMSELGRLQVAPPGVPPATLAVLRTAMAEVVKDPGFVADSEKLNLPIDFLPGDVVAEKIKAALAQPPDVVAALKAVSGS